MNFIKNNKKGNKNYNEKIITIPVKQVESISWRSKYYMKREKESALAIGREKFSAKI